jgi:hypothetical protein
MIFGKPMKMVEIEVKKICHRKPVNVEKAGVRFFFSLDSDT